MTPLGRATLALGLGTYLAAWAFGASALYAPAVGLVLAVALALLWTRLLSRPLRLHRSLDRERPVEGDDVAVRVELEPEGGGILPGSVRLHDPAGGLGVRDVVVPREGRRLYTVYRLERVPRGRYRFTGAEVAIEDPFGLARQRQQLSDTGTLIVYPRLANLTTLFSERGLRAHGGGRMLLRRPAGFDLHSVREYEDGESLRRVHWPSTARRQQLMVKELEDAPRDEVVVVLDAQAGFGGGQRPEWSFDVQVRAAGSILAAHARRGRNASLIVTSAAADCVSVRSYERDWPRAMEALAAAEQDGRRPLEAFLGETAGPAARASDLVAVTPALRPALVEALIGRAVSRQLVSVVYIDLPSFERRGRRAGGAESAVLRLEAAGISVAVVGRGDDLAAILAATAEGAAVG
ncbi:MAG TPA: DUF58 domain-containing protein [Gaiellaceae bacterium]|nr:DUF58 domain-containing protein [Gaiellaceae bacterium]